MVDCYNNIHIRKHTYDNLMTTSVRKVSDEDALEMLRLHRHAPNDERMTQREIAKMYDVHPQTVSRAIKRAEGLYAEFERGVESGEIRRPQELQVSRPSDAGGGGGGGGSLMLPHQFVEVLSDMNQMQSACQATGTFLATAAHAVYEGFVNEDIPHDQRFRMVVTGSSAAIGTFFEIYDGIRQIQKMARGQRKPKMRTVESETDEDGF